MLFYRVSFNASGCAYFFKSHENACAFLLESYFDEYEVESEDEVIAINNEVADDDCIDGYGSIDECYFED